MTFSGARRGDRHSEQDGGQHWPEDTVSQRYFSTGPGLTDVVVVQSAQNDRLPVPEAF